MATENQTEANRRNAKKSTGPRTPEGKSRSSMNHLKTGIDAQSSVIRGEDPAELQALADRYIARLQPATEDERHQVDVLIRCDWQARRLDRCEAQVWNQSQDELLHANKPYPVARSYSAAQRTLYRIDLRLERNERLFNRARHELAQLQAARRAAESLEAQAPEPEAPTEELGSNLQDIPDPAATQPEPPLAPKFGPETALAPEDRPGDAPPKTA